VSREHRTSIPDEIVGERLPERLVVRAKPHDGESYLGFVLRLTELNAYEATMWVRELAGIPVPLPIGTLISRIEADLPRLARLIGYDVTDFRCLLYEPIVYNYDAPVLGSSHPPHVLRLRRPKLCPKCLQEQNYCRKLWDYTAATACPTHNVLLVDECRTCHRRITWARKRVSICRCSSDFREAEVSKVTSTDVQVSRLILGKLQGASNSHNFFAANPLTNLNLASVLGALFFVGVQQQGGDRLVRSFPSLTVREAHDAMLKAFRVFEDWPNNFHAFLDEKCSMKSGHVSANRLFNRYGSIARQLYRVSYLPEPISLVLRKEFEAHVTEKWEEGHLQAPLWFSKHCGQYLNRKKAAAILNVAPQIIERMVREGELGGTIVRKTVRQNFSVDAAGVDNLLRLYRRSLSMYEATRVLGLRSGHVTTLLKRGLLTAISLEPDVRIDTESVHSLLETVFATIKKSVKSKEHLRDFRNILHRLSVRLSKQSWGVDDLVTDILNGQLRPKATRPDRTGFRKLQFAASDVARYQKRKITTLDEYMVLEPNGSFGFRPATLYFLARRGLIRTKRAKGNRNMAARIITRAAVETFSSNHVTARSIARVAGTSIPFIVKTLEAQGVFPVSGISVDGGPMYIFKRSDIDDNRIECIKGTPRVLRARGSLPINSTEVARLLSISEADVQQLVANDVLRPFGDSPCADTEHLFNRKIAEGLKAQFTIKLTDLLSSNAAAALLGIARRSFRFSCIKSGYLKYETSQDGKKRFFRRHDVEKIAEFLQSVVHESEAAKLLDTSRAVIERCGRQKLLTVVRNRYPKMFQGTKPARLYLRREIADVTVIEDPTNRHRKNLVRLDALTRSLVR